jgi:hypothetical protein
MKSSLFTLFGFLSAAVVFSGLWHFRLISNGWLDAVTGRDKSITDVTSKIPSPNQQYVATILRVKNNFDWCEIRISLTKINEPLDWENKFICITGCDTQLDLKWEDDKKISIIYSVKDKEKAVNIYQEFWSKDKGVKISYSLKE